MKLYEVPRNSKIRIKGLTINGELSEELLFHHIDGMYSFCTANDGTIIHLEASTECELIENKENYEIKKT